MFFFATVFLCPLFEDRDRSPDKYMLDSAEHIIKVER